MQPCARRNPIGTIAAVVVSSFLSSAGPCRAGTTVDATHYQAYGANIGWLNVRGDATNGAALGSTYCTGFVWTANCGWIGLGNGPTNGWQYSNASASDWGVNHDGSGRLNGYAYGANVGWLVFEQSQGQPRVDLRTGNLSGYIWGANVGWISLSNSHGFVRTSLEAGPDADGDGLADAYEFRHTNNLTVLSGLDGHDADADGASDAEEAAADTDPLNEGDHLQILSIHSAGGGNQVEWNARPTRLYRLDTTNTLTRTGSWTDSGSGLLGPPDGLSMSQTVSTAAQTTGFYRVRAVVPLAPE